MGLTPVSLIFRVPHPQDQRPITRGSQKFVYGVKYPVDLGSFTISEVAADGLAIYPTHSSASEDSV